MNLLCAVFVIFILNVEVFAIVWFFRNDIKKIMAAVDKIERLIERFL